MAVISSSAGLQQPDHTSEIQKTNLLVKPKTKMSQHDSPKFPPLAPGPPRMFAPQSSMTVSRPKKNSTACLSCKTAKRKVSVGPSDLAIAQFPGAEANIQRFSSDSAPDRHPPVRPA